MGKEKALSGREMEWILGEIAEQMKKKGLLDERETAKIKERLEESEEWSG